MGCAAKCIQKQLVECFLLLFSRGFYGLRRMDNGVLCVLLGLALSAIWIFINGMDGFIRSQVKSLDFPSRTKTWRFAFIFFRFFSSKHLPLWSSPPSPSSLFLFLPSKSAFTSLNLILSFLPSTKSSWEYSKFKAIICRHDHRSQAFLFILLFQFK